MNKKLALGLGIVGALVLVGGAVASSGSFLDKLLELTSTKLANQLSGTQGAPVEETLGATQTYPLHFLNATAYDQVFTWGGLENAGVTWLTGAVNASSTMTISGATTLGSSLTVSGALTAATTTVNGHLIVGAGTPTVAVGGASWAAGTLSGDDVTGFVSSTAAASTPGQITVNFGAAYAVAPICTISLANVVTNATSTGAVFVTSSLSAFSINFPLAVAPQAYVFNYHCLQ